MDNEAFLSFQMYLKSKGIDFQLAPPRMNFLNVVERLISTFKDHFVAGLYSTYPYLTMQNWDRLLEQAEITLNLLRPSILKPKL